MFTKNGDESILFFIEICSFIYYTYLNLFLFYLCGDIFQHSLYIFYKSLYFMIFFEMMQHHFLFDISI